MIAGIIPCGGRSLRMGSSKAWLPFGEEVLLQRVVRILGELADPIVVVAAAGQDLPPLPEHVQIVRDLLADRGPLQGFAAGLEVLPDEVDLVYLTSTDAPFLRAGWVRRLVERLGTADIALPEIGGRLHPLAALYRTGNVRAAARFLIANGRSRLLDLAGLVATVHLDEACLIDVDPDFRTIRNLNHPEEYDEALRFLAIDQAS